MRTLTINKYGDHSDYLLGGFSIHRKVDPDESVTGMIDEQDLEDFLRDKTQNLEQVEVGGVVLFRLVR